jgi:hypothetical protein
MLSADCLASSVLPNPEGVAIADRMLKTESERKTLDIMMKENGRMERMSLTLCSSKDGLFIHFLFHVPDFSPVPGRLKGPRNSICVGRFGKGSP